jgi:hypothetical protein
VTEPSAPAQPDPRKAFYIFATGSKGSGKSHYCRSWFDAYPFDKLVIDPTHDIRKDFRREGLEYVDLGDGESLPVRFPKSSDERRPYVTAVFCPDMGHPAAMDQIDRAAGLVLRGSDQRAMLWLDEVGTSTTGNKTPPNHRRILHHGRHDNLNLLAAGPRAMDIDPLFIAQADLVAQFDCASVYDIDRVAKTIGYNADELAELNREHCRRHAYLLWDAADRQMYKMPAIPPRRAGRNHYPPVPDSEGALLP